MRLRMLVSTMVAATSITAAWLLYPALSVLVTIALAQEACSADRPPDILACSLPRNELASAPSWAVGPPAWHAV